MKIIECPRDAMQGMIEFIPTEKKIQYINKLMRVGFDTIDFGSFVSPKAIPQLRDTKEVIDQIDVSVAKSSLLAIVANTRGAEDAAAYDKIRYIGFPLSLSETFQVRNTNKSISEALQSLTEIQAICESSNKTLVTYISMGFGNPYNDPYDKTMVAKFVDVLATLGVQIVSLADTIGIASAHDVASLFSSLSKEFAGIEIGVHLHSRPESAWDKIDAAFSSGCKRIDGALNGYGGCPMAKDELVGNLATETIVSYLQSKGEKVSIDEEAYQDALKFAGEIFPKR